MSKDQDDLETSTVDIDILRAFLDKEVHDKFKDIFKTYMLTPVGWGLLGDMSAYYESHPVPKIEEEAWRLWFRIARHPIWKPEKHSIYTTIFDNLFDGEVKPDIVALIAKHRTLEAMKGAIDKNDTEELNKLVSDLTNIHSTTDDPKKKMVTDSVEEIINTAVRHGGLSWRLNDLNIACGPLSRGDFVIIGKRPETGGTSFLLSEFTHMVSQLPEGKHALIVNNEEYKTKVITRLVCTACDISAPTLYGDPHKYSEDYIKFLGTKRIDVLSDGTISTFEIERLLRTGDYGLIGVNVLEKLDGVSRKLEDHQRLEKLGQWCRRMALEYGPVMAIVQADVSADNVMYPEQSMLYKTKTGLQAEADLLIMMGNTREMDEKGLRGIHVAKNKLPGTSTTNPKFRHIRSEVNFDIETGRFTSKHMLGGSK